MEKLKVDDMIWDLMGIPERENEKGNLNRFWRDLESPNIKTAMIFCILNELRTAPLESIPDEKCRTILARCQGYVTMLDLPEVLLNQKRKDEGESELSPADVEFEFEE